MNKVLIEAVVDRSGSMMTLANDAIGGFNTWLSSQQEVDGAADLTLTLFDHQMLTTHFEDIRVAPPLSGDTYVPRGNTALNDAIGQALNRLESKAPDKAILMILTDGQENASREFKHDEVKRKIEAAQARGWQVVYLSTDISGFDTATRTYGVSAANAVQADHTGVGLRGLYTATAAMNSAYRAGNNEGEVEQSGSSSGS